MYLELKETALKSWSALQLERPGLAYLMTGVTQKVETDQSTMLYGMLYAISDEEGVQELYANANRLEAEGEDIFIDTAALYAGENFFKG